MQRLEFSFGFPWMSPRHGERRLHRPVDFMLHRTAINKCDNRDPRRSPLHCAGSQVGIVRAGLRGAVLLCWLTLSVRGADTTAVPRLAGERVGVARQLAALAELKPVVGVYQIAAQNWRDDLRPGVVYLQSAQPGEPLPRNSRIALWTFVRAAEGARIVTMPDLHGQTAAAAARRLKELGLPTMIGDGDPAPDDSTVADQFPVAGDSLIVGTSVYLTWVSAKTAE